MGGPGSFWGVLLSSAVFTGLPDLLRFSTDLRMVLYGVVLVVAMLVLPGGETVTGLVVHRRTGGLTDADKAKIAADAQRAARELPVVGAPVVPFADGSPPSLVSPAGDLAYMIVAVPDDNDRIAEWGTDLRGAVHEDTPEGLEVYGTGDEE